MTAKLNILTIELGEIKCVCIPHCYTLNMKTFLHVEYSSYPTFEKMFVIWLFSQEKSPKMGFSKNRKTQNIVKGRKKTVYRSNLLRHPFSQPKKFSYSLRLTLVQFLVDD